MVPNQRPKYSPEMLQNFVVPLAFLWKMFFLSLCRVMPRSRNSERHSSTLDIDKQGAAIRRERRTGKLRPVA